MNPVDKINRNKFGNVPIKRFPENIGSSAEGLQHFMFITEYEFIHSHTKGRDALTSFSEGLESERNYRSKGTYVLYLPKGSLKTQYTADHSKVDFGFFGALLNAESSDILNRLQAQLPGVLDQKDTFARSADFWGTMGSTVYDELAPNVERYIKEDYTTKAAFNVGEAIGGLLLSKDKTASIASLSMRKSGNPYSTLVFAGIKERRQHAFAFDFYPRNSTESKSILDLTLKLKRGMLPEYHVPRGEIVEEKKKSQVPLLKTSVKAGLAQFGGRFGRASEAYTLENLYKTIEKVPRKDTQNVLKSAFFKYPNVYKIGFYTSVTGDSNKYLHQIGQSSIVDLKVTYGEGGQQVFFKDTGAPQHIKMDVTFKENFTLERNLARKLEG